MPSRKQLQERLDQSLRELQQLRDANVKMMYREAALMRIMFQLSDQLEHKRTH